MIYKKYGKTGKMVSTLGFGGMRFDLSRSQEENAQLLLHANSMGINYFDTAPGYCEDNSEIIFGKAIKQMKREDFFVTSKFMPTNGKKKQDYIDAVKKSVERLNVEAIDFYHIWCLRKMEHYELSMQEGMQYEALLEMKEQGLINHIVCSSHQPGHEIKQIVDDGKVEGVLMGVNILNFPYRWSGVEACVENDLGIVAMNPLGGGSIPTHEKELQFLCKEGETPTEAAIRFCVSSPITVTLLGFTTKEHINQACKVVDNATMFTNEEIAKIKLELGENMNSSCTGCGYCLKGCPEKINIPAYLQIYNEKIMFNKSDADLKSEFKGSHGWGTLVATEGWAKDCIQCGNCEIDCTQHLDIINRLDYIATLEND